MNTRAMVLSDGGLASLVAAAIEVEAVLAEGEGAGPMPALAEWPGLDRSASDAVRRQAEALGLHAQPIPGVMPSEWSGGREAEALLHAAYTALSSGCSRLVWAVQYACESEDDTDLEREAIAVDRALLVSRLATLDASAFGLSELRVETPMVDLTDHQLAELALDLGVPLECCEWWDHGGAAERDRWLKALRFAGWVAPQPVRGTVSGAGGA